MKECLYLTKMTERVIIMKKIKILTLIGNNYGGALQAYALYHTIKKYDKNVSIINYSPFFGKLSLKDYINFFNLDICSYYD